MIMHKWPWPSGSLSITDYRNLGHLTFIRTVTGQLVDKCSASLLPNWEMLLAKQFPLFKDDHKQLSHLGSAGGWRVYLRVTGLFDGFICGQTDPANQFWQMGSTPSQYTSQHVITSQDFSSALKWSFSIKFWFDYRFGTDVKSLTNVPACFIR